MSTPPQKIPFWQADDFELRELIYEGPHTLVFRGCQSSLQRPVVVKLLKPHVKDRREWMERFRREARVCARLKHPHIVDVYALGEKEDYHYIAIEYIEGLSLKDLLQKAAPLPPGVALAITDQILQALAFVHQHHVIHRDVKPGNILLSSAGQAKLSDFGLAQIEAEPTVTQQGALIGTPAYMAPEQISGERLDGRTDLFSLGAVLYEMLSGRQAFGGENYSTCLYKIMNEQPSPLGELNQAIEENLAGYVETFLHKAPGERWPDAQAARARLQNLLREVQFDPAPGGVAEFIRPFLPESNAPKPSAALAEEISPTAKPAVPQLRRSALKRRFLWGGLAALLLGIGAVIAALNMAGEFSARPQQLPGAVSPAADSSAGDSLLAANHSPGAPGLSEDRGQENPSAPPEEEISNPAPRRAAREPQAADSLPGMTAVPQPPDSAAATPPSFATALSTQLNIEVEPWAKIVIDGQEADSHVTRRNFPLSPGKHTVAFLNPGFSPQVMQVDLAPGEEKSLRWSFLLDAGFLWVEARPWAEVFIDNKFHDTTPLNQPLVLSSGEHLLELKHPRLAAHREIITIRAGDTLRVQAVLNQP